MKKALVTGISGFAGSHLADYLLQTGQYDLSGTYLDENSLKNLNNPAKIRLQKLNLLDEDATEEFIRKEKPDILFHLAALTSPRNSFDSPKETFINNISAQINILESVKKNKTETRILVVSSAEVYGLVSSENLPIDEDAPFNPTNPYAVSKLAQDFLGLQYYLSDKLKIVRVRPFNHVGPRQSPRFVISAFAKQIAEIERGKGKIMKVGKLAARRDFTDVRDMVKAYTLALNMGELGDVYNLGRGRSYRISEILEMLKKMSSVKISVETEPALLKHSDDRELLCDFSRFEKLTGWKPEIPIEKTLQDTLDYWRNQV
ncbi:MAG: GDP-mannose 4,6-dehydratase [Candidatus Levybacteria bacterium]|nr:GDP-mannose 4,6-dehydratase [Candidatus Levybacteria bacterium]